jgi:hypothetical protein
MKREKSMQEALKELRVSLRYVFYGTRTRRVVFTSLLVTATVVILVGALFSI